MRRVLYLFPGGFARWLTCASAGLVGAACFGATEPEVFTLQEFIVEETALAGKDTLRPGERPAQGVLIGDGALLDTARAVTVISPEAMKQLGVNGFDDLDRVGAGLTRPNTFGIQGLPFIRGDYATVFFNGMPRIPSENLAPTSFGSLEALDVVKGPAPAHFGAALSGGYTNFIPKSPFFDRFRGSVAATVGSFGFYDGQIDVGGPFLLVGKPAAYRVSVGAQENDGYYDRVSHSQSSVYAALKTQLTPRLKVYAGGEYYDFQSNENAGWNRVTQALIDRGEYIVGDIDPNTVDPARPGAVDPVRGSLLNQSAIAFGLGYDPALALVVPAAVFQRRYGAPTGVEGAYLDGPAARATPVTHEGRLYGYKYTPEYFDAGGGLFTTRIKGNQVLSDDSDFADARTFLGFLDFISEAGPDRSVTLKFFVDGNDGAKISSYGYATEAAAWAAAAKLIVDEKFDVFDRPLAVQYGGEYRHAYNRDAGDYFYEPFNRRDISRAEITPQSVVRVGPQTGWDPNTSYSVFSEVDQAALFAQFAAQATTTFNLSGGVRVGQDQSTTGTGPQFDAKGPEQHGRAGYWNASVQPLWRPRPEITLYAILQRSLALTPTPTGVASDGGNGELKNNYEVTPFEEAGVKFSLLGDTLFATVAAYRTEQSSYVRIPAGGVDFLGYESSGLEFETTYTPTRSFSLLANFGVQRARYLESFPFATRPFTEREVALYSGAIQYGPYEDGPGEGRYADNPDGDRAGFPTRSANLFAVYTHASGWGAGLGPSWKDAYWLNDEQTLRLPASLVWNANLFYRAKRFEVFLRLNNFTDEDYFIGSTFAPTMIVTKAEPFTAQLTTTVRF